MVFKSERIRVTLSRGNNPWNIRPEFCVSYKLGDTIAEHLTDLMRRKAYKINTISFSIEGRNTAEAFFSEGRWQLRASASWLKSPVNIPLLDANLKGPDFQNGIIGFETINEMVKYVTLRASQADCKAYWPVVMTEEGWRLSPSFNLDWEPFVFERVTLLFLQTYEENSNLSMALRNSRLSPGEKYLKGWKFRGSR